MQNIFFEGFFLQASLIFALGSQNVFVLESGLQRNYPMTISFVCFLCDFFLIMLGVVGASAIFLQHPWLKIMIGILGVTFLFQYGVSKILYSSTYGNSQKSLDRNLKRSILLAITFSVLNPHAYLDAFILIGGVSAKYEDAYHRIILGVGAACYSGLWFVLLSSISNRVKPLLENPLRMKWVMGSAGVALIFLSGKLGVNVFEWIKESPPLAGHYFRDFFSYPKASGEIFTSILY